jgi:hypothetical protein
MDVVTYANGRPARPGDRVLDINSGELLVVESIDPNCPTLNILAHPAIACAFNKSAAELMPIEEVRRILNAAAAAARLTTEGEA